jgi:hypothetical protein
MTMTLRASSVTIFFLLMRLVSQWSYIVLNVSAHTGPGSPFAPLGKIGNARFPAPPLTDDRKKVQVDENPGSAVRNPNRG